MATAYPPPSPSNHNNTENSLQSTISLLESLVNFYQEERRWIERTRATLASSDGPDPQATQWSQRRLGNMRQREHVLEMFNRMIAIRLESCQRINELVRQAETVEKPRQIAHNIVLGGVKRTSNLLIMPNRYTPVPNPRSDHFARNEIEHEMQAAFDYSEDEEEMDDNDEPESRPLNPVRPSPSQSAAAPGAYDFENVDYDHPPPGSPPGPSTMALPNEYGNTNGLVPNFNSIPRPTLRQNWLQRTGVQILPSSLTNRLGLHAERPTGAMGGGVQNDGVFANVTAKPSMPVRIQEGDETYLIPEDARNEAPPSYAAAQADAVPPYWDTTVHAPFAPDAMGEIIIDSLPTGSLFSFLWNMLISISFQFVGFLLTYLLHTTHAARFGSRAGLGVTLIQYGFALRSRLDNEGEAATWKLWKQQQPTPTDSSYNSTMPSTMPAQTSSMFAEATTEWLSFFLMTIGWFILLTSVLGFWRVKRWERGILSSQRETSQPARSAPRDSSPFNLVQLSSIFRGVGRRTSRDEEPGTALSRAEEGVANHGDDARETDAMLPGTDTNSPANDRRVELLAADRRLREELQAAGFM